MAAVKSTFTRWMGFIILPELVKKWEMDFAVVGSAGDGLGGGWLSSRACFPHRDYKSSDDLASAIDMER
jgi:hypothetical protein